MADTLWMMLVSLIGNLMQTSLMWKAPPLCFIGLTSDSEACRAEWLCKLRAGWESLERLERTAQSDTEAMSFCESMRLPREQFVRGTLIRLLGSEWKEVPSFVERYTRVHSMAHHSSLCIENLFNCARSHASHNRQGRQDPHTLWHVTSTSSGCMESFERPSLPVTQAARAAAPAKAASKKLFYGQGNECSLGQSHFDHLCSSSPDWPCPGPSALMLAGAMWHCMVSAGGDWGKMRKAYVLLSAVQPWQSGGAELHEAEFGAQGHSLWSHLGVSPTGPGSLCSLGP